MKIIDLAYLFYLF